MVIRRIACSFSSLRGPVLGPDELGFVGRGRRLRCPGRCPGGVLRRTGDRCGAHFLLFESRSQTPV